MRYYLLVVCLCNLIATMAFADEAFSSLEERMTGEEFERAGLNKLTGNELRYLNEWLKKVKMQPAPASRTTTAGQSAPQATVSADRQPAPAIDQTGLRSKEVTRVTIESQIDGEFTGWSGRTRFKLKNGMVWQQVGSGEFFYRATDPKVRIEPKSLGSWKLYVDGIGRSVKVKRVK